MLFIKEEKKSHTGKSNFIISYSSRFECLEINDTTFLFYGNAWNKNRKINLENFISSSDNTDYIINELKSCNGYFCFFVINTSVTIYSSLYCAIELFYYFDESGSLTISSNLHQICSEYNLKENSIEYCAMYLEEKDDLTDLTFFKNVKKMFTGTKCVFNNNSVCAKPFLPMKTSMSLLGIIDDSVKLISSENSNINLFLSGGLDSTILFFALMHNKIEFTVYNLAPYTFEDDSETEEVINLCDRYKVKYHILTSEIRSYIKDELINNRKSFNNPRYIRTHNNLINNNEKYNEELNDPMCCFISGHGGDNIFVQNPSPKIFRDLCMGFKPVLAIKKAHQLSKLKGKHVFTLLRSSFLGKNYRFHQDEHHAPWYRKEKHEQVNFHPWLTLFDNCHAKKDYILGLLKLIYASQYSENDKSKFIYPLIFNKIISYHLNIDYEKTYNSHYDRLHVRDMAYRRYDNDIFYKKRKRSSSTLLFNIMRMNSAAYKKEFNKNIDFINEINVDYKGLMDSLEYNSKIALQSDHNKITRLFKLIKFQSFIKEGL